MADVPNFRAFLTEQIAPVLPSTWRFEPYRGDLDSLTQTTVVATLGEIQRHPAAPRSAYLIDYTLTIWTPIQLARADQALDGLIVQFVASIEDVKGLVFTGAKPVTNQSQTNLGYDVSIQIIAPKTQSDEDETASPDADRIK